MAADAFASPPWGRAVARLSDACLWVAKVSIAGMALLVTLDVVLRLVVRAPIQGAYEVVGLLGALALAGALPHAQRTHAFIVVETLTETLKGTARSLLRRAMLLIETLFFGLLAFQFVSGARAMHTSGQVSDILGWPVWLAYAAISTGFVAVTLVCLRQLLSPTAPEPADVG
jgi:TRAP-type C4-dicarboxylate transport system permease small subunit